MSMPPRRDRTGSYTVMFGFMMPVILGFTALAVDTSWLRLAESQAQDVADASAHAAMIELRRTGSTADARNVAELILSKNQVAARSGDLAEIEFGQWDRKTGGFDGSSRRPNAVKVKVGRFEADPVDLHFARIWGTDAATVQADAMAAGRSTHLVVALDISSSFSDVDFYEARDAVVALLDVLRDTGGEDDMMGLATFDYAQGVEYQPMFSLSDRRAVRAAGSAFAALETTWRGAPAGWCSTGNVYVSDNGKKHGCGNASDTGDGSASGTGNNAGVGHGEVMPWDPCVFDEGDKRAHMPRAWSQDELTAPFVGVARDHSVGLQVAEQMIAAQDDPFAYRAVILITADAPGDVEEEPDEQRIACGYEEERWTTVRSEIPSSEDDIIIRTHQVSDEAWSDNHIHQWTVSFSGTGGSLATAVQGDGKYYQTYNSAELTPIVEEIVNTMPLLIVQ